MNAPKNDNDRGPAVEVSEAKSNQQLPLCLGLERTGKPPEVTGQTAQVLNLIRRHQPILSLTMTADYAIPEAAARVHDLRAMGFNVLTTIHPSVVFRGVERRNVASYSLAVPEWLAPRQSGWIDAGLAAHLALLAVAVLLLVGG